MDVSTRGRHLNLSGPLQAYAERRLGFALGSFASRIGAVTVRIADVNGPRGGADKCCLIEIAVRSIGSLQGRATDADAYSAVDRAAARVRAVLVKALRRRREGRYSGL